MPTKDDPRITVRLDPKVFEKLQAEKAEQKMTTGSVVRAALGYYLNRKRSNVEEHLYRDFDPAGLSVDDAGATVVKDIVIKDPRVAPDQILPVGVQTYRCPRYCEPNWRPKSPNVRCQVCNSRTVPA